MAPSRTYHVGRDIGVLGDSEINSQEAQAIYGALQEVLANAGLEWVVDQVEGEIRLGRTEQLPSESPARGQYAEVGSSKLPAPPKGALTTVPYSNVDRVRLLVDAIRHAAVRVASLEASTAERLVGERIGASQITIADEDGGESIEIRRVPQERAVAVQSLVDALDAVEQAAGL